MNDTELHSLILLVQAGDRTAVTRLLFVLEKIIDKVARGYTIPGYEQDDLRQEGAMHAHMLALKYDVRKHSGFYAFFVKGLNNHYLDLLRRANNNINKSINTGVSMDADGTPSPVFSLPSPDSNPEELLLAKEKNKLFISQLQGILSPLQYDVFALYIDGYAYKEIGERLNLPAKKVDNSISAAKKKYLSAKGDELKKYLK